MKTKIPGKNLICSKDKRRNKINFRNMRSKTSEIRVKTCKCLFPKWISGETILLKRKKNVKKRLDLAF